MTDSVPGEASTKARRVYTTSDMDESEIWQSTCNNLHGNIFTIKTCGFAVHYRGQKTSE
jgi:hypothetical protein